MAPPRSDSPSYSQRLACQVPSGPKCVDFELGIRQRRQESVPPTGRARVWMTARLSSAIWLEARRPRVRHSMASARESPADGPSQCMDGGETVKWLKAMRPRSAESTHRRGGIPGESPPSPPCSRQSTGPRGVRDTDRGDRKSGGGDRTRSPYMPSFSLDHAYRRMIGKSKTTRYEYTLFSSCAIARAVHRYS